MHGQSRILFENIWPYATTTRKSGLLSHAEKFNSVLICSGWRTGMPSSLARIFTGDGVISCFLPTGLSGCEITWVTMNAGSCASVQREGQANCGVPQKTMLRGGMVEEECTGRLGAGSSAEHARAPIPNLRKMNILETQIRISYHSLLCSTSTKPHRRLRKWKKPRASFACAMQILMAMHWGRSLALH